MFDFNRAKGTYTVIDLWAGDGVTVLAHDYLSALTDAWNTRYGPGRAARAEKVGRAPRRYCQFVARDDSRVVMGVRIPEGE